MNELDLLDDIMEFIDEISKDEDIVEQLSDKQVERIGEFKELYSMFKSMQENIKDT